METIFVDTAALLALGNKNDKYHAQAKKIYGAFLKEKATLITTNAVILETANAFSKTQYKPYFIALLDMVENSSYWQYITVDEDTMEQGVNLFKSRKDKDWSLVDCIGINIAQKSNIEKIFTTDKHFKQAGFRVLLAD